MIENWPATFYAGQFSGIFVKFGACCERLSAA
jgi:hypothetical protein